jgi:putative spermidine/putrescine transport system substrate-binding protein
VAPYWRTEYGVYTTTGASVIAYNTDAFPEGSRPNRGQIFGMLRTSWSNEASIRGSGITTKSSFAQRVSPRFIGYRRENEAGLCQTQRDQATRVLFGGQRWSQPPQLLSTGEVAMAMAWSGRVAAAIHEGAPVAMTFKDAIAWGNAFVVPKGTPNRDLAMS